MAIWSMGSQTQILIGYLPVPAPLLCKYWTSTFFTVTCIWKKNKKTKRVREELGGGCIENRHGRVDMQRTPPLPSLPSLAPCCPLHLIPETFIQQVHLAPGSSVLQGEAKSGPIVLHSWYQTLEEFSCSYPERAPKTKQTNKTA